MKKYSLTILFTFIYYFSLAQVGIGTTSPSAQLDVTSTTQGILIPRVDLTSLTIQAPVINPKGGALVVSTMVFHNGTNGIIAGYYYWDGAKWQGIGKAYENRGLQFYAFSGNGASPNID